MQISIDVILGNSSLRINARVSNQEELNKVVREYIDEFPGYEITVGGKKC